MSVQFGKCNFDGKPVDPEDLDRVRSALAPYGPDGEGYLCSNNFGVLYRAFHTTKESRSELQPHVSSAGAIITWDGRLDNREELIDQLGHQLSADSTDLAIVGAAYERWETDCFAKLVGDWALSIWNPRDCSITFAKDLAGTRHLYYVLEKEQVTWCTILDPLVHFADHSFRLDEEYIAGWLSFFPATHLTPYAGIHAVPPSCFVRLTKGTRRVAKYWDFDPAKRIHYRADAEYEEHFRAVFSDAVRRRLRSDTPVLAELSGGMDSSSIVCVADDVVARTRAGLQIPRLDTVSYYDESEPNWNERPYFTKVEEKRGRTGCHIDLSTHGPVIGEFDSDHFQATPGVADRATETSKRFAACLASQGNRVVLSGIGGDEVTGGVPTPIPELEDLLATGRFTSLAHQLKIWALNKRKPWIHLLLETARVFFPPALVGVSKHRQPADWLRPRFINQHQKALTGYPSTLQLFGPLPSFQEDLWTLEGLRRQLACNALSAVPLYEKRYPYLDRDFLTFMFAVPASQLVRPGQRRSLMRRALAGIVPDEVLNRRRKAFAARTPTFSILAEWNRLMEISQQMVSGDLGLVDANVFHEQVRRARDGQEIPVVPLMRTLRLEFWLRGLQRRKRLSEEASECRTSASGTDDRDPFASSLRTEAAARTTT